ncbi:MAG: hypothetical protein Q9191_004418 [Dirinaria sp. TL-2023a]
MEGTGQGLFVARSISRPTFPRLCASSSLRIVAASPSFWDDLVHLIQLEIDEMNDQQDPTEQHKPLPPRPPRKSSSVYTLSQFAENPPYNGGTHGGSNTVEYSPTEYLEPKTYRSSTLRIPDAVPQRPKLVDTPLSHAFSESSVEQRQPKQTLPVGEESWIAKERNDLPYMQRQAGTKPMDAKQFADDYESLLAARSSTLPSSIAPDPYYPTRGDKAPPMSPRIIDVVDHSLVPSPLRFDSTEEVDEPPSRFSSDSSSSSLHGGLGDTLRKKAREAFSSHRGTPEPSDSQHLSQSSKKSKSRVSSGASHERVSIQHGLDDMYDTLASIYVPSPKSKPTTPKTTALALENAPKTRSPRTPREQHSPAIPITPYQKVGPKAWELEKDLNSSKSSKLKIKSPFGPKESQKEEDTSALPTSRPSSPSRSNKASKIDGSKQSNLAQRFASKLQNGTEKIEQAIGFETNRVRRTKSQKRREELKKKIVLVGLDDGEQGGW